VGQESGSIGTEQETKNRRRTTLGIGGEMGWASRLRQIGGDEARKAEGKPHHSQENYTSEASVTFSEAS
jgi:hypothetical protein